MKTSRWFALFVVAGALTWLLSSVIVGINEPWDNATGTLYYYSSMLGFGFIFGLLIPRLFWLVPIGIFVGQFIVIVLRPTHGASFFFPIGMAFLFGFSLLSLGGSLMGAGLRVSVQYIARWRERTRASV